MKIMEVIKTYEKCPEKSRTPIMEKFLAAATKKESVKNA